MKLNKLLCVMIALLAINTSLYAVEISVGASFGAGMPIFHGTDATDMVKSINEVVKENPDVMKKITFNLVPQVNVMFEFIPFLALETGVGFKYSTFNYTQKFGDMDTISATTRSEIYIPVMLRGQFEYRLGVTYLSAGVKLGIPISAYQTQSGKDYNYDTGNIEEIKGDDAIMIKAAPFTLDIAFALGQEFRIATSHYIGVRVGYDLNLLRPYATSAGVDSVADWFQDDFSVALTYRYAFNSKWK